MSEVLNNIAIIKVGSPTLTRETEHGYHLDRESFRNIGQQIVELANSDVNPILVSSAAVIAGMAKTRTREKPDKDTDMPELQRLASIGWRHVLNAWEASIYSRNIGELLITKHELDLDSERNELLRTTHTLLKHGDIPVINENDAITHEEITHGDNDPLAATFAAQIAHSPLFGDNVRLVLLSNVDGVIGEDDKVISRIDDIDSYDHLADSLPGAPVSNGGIASKFKAARIANKAGVDMWIANGRQRDSIQSSLAGHNGTYFPAATF